ncbi:hypothetical protein [Streptomyces xanthophaeus]|uniref:hypothetical protein n=1 Tax=Streptomyces xanthophaeus TaxID=67385 RepID=UPI002649515B|nr:hypothetical protein [Streptomyces xanthophaeus]WKD36607.1 hypothetical protein KO717_34855 [Streptomyces xanthophaeus]
MSMPQPQQPPGPYGPPQPPQPPHPYGGQPYTAPPAHQHPYQGQPYPGQPGPPQPYPGHGAWGQPPTGMPPRKNRIGMVIGIIAGAVLVLGAVGAVGARLTGSGFPEARYRLTVPKTLVDGKYELVQDHSATAGKKALEGSYDSTVRDPKPTAGQYASESPKESGALVVSGMYGRFKDTAGARKKMLRGAAESEGASLAVPARDITPTGSDITLSCQVLTVRQSGVESSLPMCAWVDENTGATVGIVSEETVQQKPGSVDLAKTAETTLKVRAEMRKPIG